MHHSKVSDPQQHSLQQRQHHMSIMNQDYVSRAAGGTPQISQDAGMEAPASSISIASASASRRIRHLSGHLSPSAESPKQPLVQSQQQPSPPDKNLYSSIPSASSDDMSEDEVADEVSDIMDIPMESSSSDEERATYERLPHSLLPSQLLTSRWASPLQPSTVTPSLTRTKKPELAGSGSGGAPAFQAPPPAQTAAFQTKVSSLEKGDFGFEVANIIDKKKEMVGDYDSMRVANVEHEGAARFSGRVIQGDYVLRVNQVDLRGRALGEVLDLISDAPAKSTFELMDAKHGGKSKVELQREIRSREDMFLQRLQNLRSNVTDMNHLTFLLNSCVRVDKEDERPSFVVCGFPGVGKSTLINTILAAVNRSDYSVADATTPTMEYTRYEQVLRGADDNPFTIADTSGLTGDEAVFASLRNIVKGRHKNNSKMDNSWRSIKKAVADQKKRAHGVILVADARQKVSGSIVDAINEMSAAEDDVPVVVAWTHVLDVPAQGLMERMRSMLTALPSAVNFPTLHYQTGQSGVVKVDFSVLDMMAYLRNQSKRYIRYAQQEAAFKA
jgi:hypothetical protein